MICPSLTCSSHQISIHQISIAFFKSASPLSISPFLTLGHALPYQGNYTRSIDLRDSTGTVNATAYPNPGQGSPPFSFNYSFWTKYKEYLLRNSNRHTAKCRLIYARDYSYVLSESNASSLLLLSHEKRIHIMKALAVLSKYVGCYDRWKNIIPRYQLKWSNADTKGAFNDVMMNNEHT